MLGTEQLERLQEIQIKYAKLGWIPREDILWLMEALEHLCKAKANKKAGADDRRLKQE
ncbi:MAG: hypothetical protein AB1589_30925 [Cyanobacteriota bacterium]